ncbi:TIGR01777 family protein [Nocardioides sp. dk4132]|uniref:TIGR01777 family oxidoreductase n=1 Tax=unclassified Nocardioides TaxID=2615069 RepID=UPI0012948BCD|nr:MULTISPECIES: TIGR01777 family oxidoreductase [unclassified Nocardioides]MQW77280.1 TIGR01777 family protein [Nocardioides sp. dk4132]QGA08035.1 TIGR01777 family protein [Nocardioides sp. dk884]
MHVVIAGSSGFLGTHLRAELDRRGHRTTALVRRPATGPGESTWDPGAGTLDRDVVASADVVVNLAGSPTLGNPHSRRWARELEQSRVRSTDVLARAVADCAGAGRGPAFLAGNGISYYGDHGEHELTEASDSRGQALLTRVTRVWQAAAQPAVDAGARVVVLRTAPVMDRRAAPLRPLVPLFRAGLGAFLGNGRQHMAMCSLRDWVGGVVHTAEHPDLDGPVNLTCPEPPTNAEFTRELAAQLHRPALALVPGPLLRLGAGGMAPELLGSLNVRPAKLLDSGYEFHDPDVASVLATGLAAS